MKNEQNIIILADRGAWQTVKDWAHKPVRSLIEKAVGGYGEKMEVLREQDKQIQQWAKELKDTINGIRKGIKSNKFIDIAISLKELELKLNNMIGSGQIIQDVVESDLDKLDMEHDGNLDVFKESSMNHSLMSEAGWWEDKKTNWVHNKFLTKQRKERILALKKMLAVSEMTVGAVLQYVDQLKTARDRGNINNYLNVMQKISNEQTKFLNTFTPIYEKYLKPLVDKALAEESSLLDKQKIEELTKLEQDNDQEEERQSFFSAFEVAKSNYVSAKNDPSVDPKKLEDLKLRYLHAKEAVEEILKDEESNEVGGEAGSETPDNPASNDVNIPDLDTRKPKNRSVEQAAGMLGLVDAPDSTDDLEGYRRGLEGALGERDRLLKYLDAVKADESALEPNDSISNINLSIKNINREISDAQKAIKNLENKPSTLETVTLAHTMFLDGLYKMAQNNNKYDVAVMILKYAELVEEVDEDASLKLMAIAEGLIDD